MMRVLTVGVGAGLAFAVLDGLLNANPVAQRVYAFYQPIARHSVNARLGLAVDMLSGVLMAAVFVRMMPVLPGGPIARGLVFGWMVWYFRVAMNVAAQAVMFRIPGSALAYGLAAGFVEMSLLGMLYGIALQD